MRNELKRAIKAVMTRRLILTREELDLTQEEMAESLHMSHPSYSNLEHGVNCCGAVTLFLYFFFYCDDPKQLIAEVKEAWEDAYTRL